MRATPGLFPAPYLSCTATSSVFPRSRHPCAAPPRRCAAPPRCHARARASMTPSAAARFAAMERRRTVPRRLRASRRRALSREFFSASGGPLERCRLYADRANRRRGSPPNPAVPLHLCPR
jgi:hypothetical protein